MMTTILNNILILSFLQLVINYILAFTVKPRYMPLYKRLSYVIVILAIIVPPVFDWLWLIWQLSMADNVSIAEIDSDYAIFKPVIFIAIQLVFNTFILQQILDRNGR